MTIRSSTKLVHLVSVGQRMEKELRLFVAEAADQGYPVAELVTLIEQWRRAVVDIGFPITDREEREYVAVNGLKRITAQFISWNQEHPAIIVLPPPEAEE